MNEAKFLKRLPQFFINHKPAPEHAVFYDMDNDCFYKWLPGGKLMKYVRAYSFMEEKNENISK